MFLQLGHALAQTGVVLQAVHAGRSFRRQKPGYVVRHVCRALPPRERHAQRAAVDRDPGHVDGLQIVPPGKLIEGCQRVIAQMLVIDRVEFDLFDQVLDVRRFDHHDPVVLEQCPKPLHDSVEIGHVCQDIVRMNHVGPLASVSQALGDGCLKELADSRHTLLLRDPRDVASWFHTQYGNAGPHVVLQQVAVVAGNFHNQTVWSQLPLPDQVRSELARVTQHGVGERREIRIFTKQLLGWYGLGDLDERTVRRRRGRADRRARRRQLVGLQERVRQGSAAERQDRL